jgi:hypothetical protein
MPTIRLQNQDLAYDKNPDWCVLCHHAIEPSMVTSNCTGRLDDVSTHLELVFHCTRQACSRLFIARYSRSSINQAGKGVGDYKFVEAVPKVAEPPQIPEEVSKVSEQFAVVYSQAKTAEALGLDQIAGVGYRRALEFLIKDYCISRHPDKRTNIENKFLANCIDLYIEDVNLKECARRAVWLGNDETHYVRRWEDRDIRDLKVLLDLTISWIRTNLLTQRYLEEMNPRSK